MKQIAKKMAGKPLKPITPVRKATSSASNGVAKPKATGTQADLKLYESRETKQLKKQICDIGRRIWLREYCDGNGGNISVRVGSNRFLITPTDVSKGFMKPQMISMVDINGKWLAGTWKPSTEFTTHAAIYRTTPDAISVCHAHPCHAGAFAVRGIQPPPRLIPELEIYVGTVALAPYAYPGGPEIAALVGPLAPQHQSIIMVNHGTICWGKSIEDAYFKIEITDAYCRTVILGLSLPGGAAITPEELPALLDRKKRMGMPDDRYNIPASELSKDDPWALMGAKRG